MTQEKHSGRGGARRGAGRPRKEEPSRLYSFRASGEMADFLDSHEDKSRVIKGCIAKEMAERKNYPPEDERWPDLSAWGEVYYATEVKEMKIPYFDIGIVAGFPLPLDNDERAQNIELLQMLCPCPESSYLIRVEGNSMIDANIHSGDIVIVDKSNRNPSPSEVAVCELNGEYTLKRFEMRDGVGWLIPANPDYPEICVTEEDSFSIWGTVTYVIHRPQGD